MRYLIVCERCGKERRSSKRPGGLHTPKACQNCNIDRQRVAFARMTHRPPLPAREPRNSR